MSLHRAVFEVHVFLSCDLLTSRTATGLTVLNGKGKIVITAEQLRLDFYSDGELVLSANARNLMRFEHTREKAEVGEGEEEESEDEPGMWEESFGGNTDSKPRGPQGRISLSVSG